MSNQANKTTFTLEELYAQLEALAAEKVGEKIQLLRQIIDKLLSANAEEKDSDLIEKYLSEASETLENKALSPEEQAENTHEIARLYAQNGDLDIAMELQEKALDIYTTLGQKKETIKVHYRMALVLVGQGKVEEGTAKLEEVGDLASEHDDYEILGNVSASLGDLASINEEYKEAIEHYKAAIEAYRTGEFWSETGSVYQIIGEILVKHNKTEQAIKSYTEGIDFFTQKEDFSNVGQSHSRIASLLEQKSEFRASAQQYEQSAEAFAKAENWYETANRYLQGGYVLETDKEWLMALALYEKAVPYAQKSDDEALLDSVMEGIEEVKETIEKESKQKKNTAEDGGGFLGTIKGWFGK